MHSINVLPPPFGKADVSTSGGRKVRNSNLELYRIIVMLLIIAHHFVVNSGLTGHIIENGDYSAKSGAMMFFGAFGKTGINCFVLITGYFMSGSNITLAKFVKLYGQMVFYSLIISMIFFISGHDALTARSAVDYVCKIFPARSISDNFGGCFMVFYLCLPFLIVFVKALTRRQHFLLICLLLLFYTLLPMFPKFSVRFNYVEWFSILFVVASYIRRYNALDGVRHSYWGWATLGLLLGYGLFCVAVMNNVADEKKFGYVFHFVSDSNKVLAFALALCSFMWFKGLKIRQSRLINALGASTFGVLLIHANSDTMRQWLWVEKVKVVDSFIKYDTADMLLYAAACVVVIFMACASIDIVRSRFIERPLNSCIERAVRRVQKHIGPKLPR